MAAHLNIDSELLTVKLNPIASSVWSSNNFLPFHLVNLIAYKWSTYRLSLKRKKFKFLFDNDITWICFKTDSFYWKLLHISDLIRVNSKLLRTGKQKLSRACMERVGGSRGTIREPLKIVLSWRIFSVSLTQKRMTSQNQLNSLHIVETKHWSLRDMYKRWQVLKACIRLLLLTPSLTLCRLPPPSCWTS